jgi:hypothetical protein
MEPTVRNEMSLRNKRDRHDENGQRMSPVPTNQRDSPFGRLFASDGARTEVANLGSFGHSSIVPCCDGSWTFSDVGSVRHQLAFGAIGGHVWEYEIR